MPRWMCLVLVVGGCLDPERGKRDGEVDVDAALTTPDAATSGCDVVLEDHFEGELDIQRWSSIVAGGSVTPTGDMLRLDASAAKTTSRASVQSNQMGTLASTHVIANLSAASVGVATDAGIAWYRGSFADYYTVFLRDGELRAAYELEDAGVVSLCEPGLCVPYGNDTPFTVRMSATPDGVQLAVSFDGIDFIDFDPAPGSGLPYGVWFGVNASETSSTELEVDDVVWYDCPPS